MRGILTEMDNRPDLGYEEFVAEAAEVFGEVMPEEDEPVETQMRGMATMIGVLLWRVHGGQEQLKHLNLSYTEYQNRLRRREHGGMALNRLESDVAEILGRSRYEFQTK